MSDESIERFATEVGHTKDLPKKKAGLFSSCEIVFRLLKVIYNRRIPFVKKLTHSP